MVVPNESSRDRDMRLVLGAILMVFAVFVIPGILGFVVGGLALVLLATAAVGFCPIYAVLGYSTCERAGRGHRS